MTSADQVRDAFEAWHRLKPFGSPRVNRRPSPDASLSLVLDSRSAALSDVWFEPYPRRHERGARHADAAN